MGELKGVMSGHMIDGSKWVHVFYFSTSDTNIAAAGAINQFCSDWWDTEKQLVANGCSFDQVIVYTYSTGGWDPINTYTHTSVGTNSGTAMPNFVAPVVLGLTGVRRCRAKKALLAPAQSMCTNQDAGSTLLSLMTTLMNLWVTIYTNDGVTIYPGAFRKKTGQIAAFIGGAIDAHLGSMRTRKTGRGV